MSIKFKVLWIISALNWSVSVATEKCCYCKHIVVGNTVKELMTYDHPYDYVSSPFPPTHTQIVIISHTSTCCRCSANVTSRYPMANWPTNAMYPITDTIGLLIRRNRFLMECCLLVASVVSSSNRVKNNYFWKIIHKK